MKVLLAQQYPFETNKFPGGVHTAGYYLARGLQERDDVDVSVLTVSGQAKADLERVDDGLHVSFLSERKLRLIPNMTRNIRRLTRRIRAIGPDVVNGNLAIYAAAGVRSGIPTVYTIHGVIHREAEVWRRPLDRLRYALYVRYDREAVTGVEHVIATSPYVVREYEGRTGAKFHVIDNCIDPRFFQVENREEPGRILFGGLVYERKNVLGLLEIVRILAQRHRDIELRVAGKSADPNYFRLCREFVRRHGLENNVRFLGMTTVEQMMEELSRAMMLVLPSRQETAPLVISEALSAGTPVVASTVGGIPDLVRHGETGFLAEWHDNNKFAEHIERLLEDDSLRARMRSNAREEALRRFTRDRVAAQTAAVYREVLGL